MSVLRIEPVDDATLEDWRSVHNLIIPTDPLSPDEVRERVGRNHLTVAYRDDVLVGCATVRPPTGDPATATVIVRVLPEHRRRGYGEEYHAAAVARARELGAEVIETIVLASNPDGLRFAESHGFVEVDRYLPPGDEYPFLTLRLL
ncbi:GNAT family N-acetyltransferase [Longispora fulva]|uniref:GNAT superfamily N-acetyltransferase n=1 Tax=Longispora fulva TaxID=619741 RepID=A0A8J7GFU5_9ACTN|nr:GNAT family N-acetyltransferase [Longispora fulva]MBG6136975.1 GNAT superfamily N-acetyltransferase [Longispora fulva]